MPIQAIKIPQNVYIEDRIVGPLTLKQILIVGAGVGFSYALYGMLTKAYGALALPITITVWTPAGIASIFAFIRINDISMFRLVLLMVERLNKPSTRVWTPRRGITVNIRTFNAPEGNQKNQAADARTNANVTQLDELSVILDRPMHKKEEEEPETLSPMEEKIEEEPEEEAQTRLPVDRSRVTVNAVTRGASMDTIASAAGSVSLFRDISPHA